MRKLLAKYPSMLSLCFIGASSSPPSPTMLYAFPSSQSHRSTTFALCTAHLLARTWAVSVASYLPGTLLFSAPLPPSTPMRTMMWSKRAQESWLASRRRLLVWSPSPRPDEYAVTLLNVLFGIVFESSMFGSSILSEPKYYVFPLMRVSSLTLLYAAASLSWSAGTTKRSGLGGANKVRK